MNEILSTDQYLDFKKKLAALVPDSDDAELPSREVWQLFESIGIDQAKYPQVFVLLGECIELGLPPKSRYVDELACYDLALEICPTCPDALRAKGHCFITRDQLEEGYSLFQVAHEIDPTIETAMELAVIEFALRGESNYWNEAKARLREMTIRVSELSQVVDSQSP
ncbi:hypothetical protein [Bremerella cremea]|nr:hypothetical protein [Bremerella cremea]